ncbi:hypothetical protein [Streptomyces regalis]|uniref:DUF2795 domain-containing protein n=1 Tax=Streptomyces regalis TaxID=68262 RepID=A0A101JGE4_9ACTN|nr:hypothetical protein [Streptomyces regalis]KUL26368.1 hypothetical protein ADL12_32525 [Streptomyces regalis]
MAEEVTRIEIADHLAGLFANGAMSKHDLLIASAGARPEVREVLAALPDDRRYTELRQVWEDLPLVPVGA